MKMNEEELRSELNKIMKDYRKFNKSIRLRFEALGITVLRAKNHIILGVPSCGCIKRVPLACTGSDWRAGKNMISIILHLMTKSDS